jgi:hypothetical protein
LQLIERVQLEEVPSVQSAQTMVVKAGRSSAAATR